MPTWEVRLDLYIDPSDPELLRAMIEAEALARAIRGIPISPLARQRINQLNIVRAVRGTTGIEGARLTEDEVAQILGRPGSEPVLPRGRQREEMEARNSDRVIAFVAQRLDSDPDIATSEALICELHRLTTEGIDYENNEPGKYRSHAVTAGEYVPPRSHFEVRDLMERFVAWLNGPAHAYPPITRAIAAHFYFISIHPFGDGNGRTARAIESLLLWQAKVNVLGFYSLANFYYRNRPQYIGMLDHVRFRSGGSLMPFLLFSARGLVEELDGVYAEVIAEATVVAFHDYARETLQLLGRLGTPSGNRMMNLVTFLGRDGVDLFGARRAGHPLAALYSRLAAKTLARDIDYLQHAGLVARDGRRLLARLDAMEQFKP